MTRVTSAVIFFLALTVNGFADESRSPENPWDQWAEANPSGVAPEKPFSNAQRIGVQMFFRPVIRSFSA